MHVDTMLRRLSGQAGRNWIDNRASERVQTRQDQQHQWEKVTEGKKKRCFLWKASCMARMHRSTGTAHLQLGMGLGKRSRCSMEMCLPGGRAAKEPIKGQRNLARPLRGRNHPMRRDPGNEQLLAGRIRQDSSSVQGCLVVWDLWGRGVYGAECCRVQSPWASTYLGTYPPS